MRRPIGQLHTSELTTALQTQKNGSMNFAKHVNYARSLGAGSYSEDVVQEAYIKCHRLGKLNESDAYINSTIRSVYFDLKKKKSISFVELNNDIHTIIDDSEQDETPIKLDEVEPLLKDVHFFHVEVFRLYLQELNSIRKIAKATRISERTIFNSIKICKEKLKQYANQKDLEIQ